MASDRPTPEPNRGDRREEMVMSEPNVVDGSTLHLLPADAYPGLLDGWCGPVLALDNREKGCHLGNFGLPEDEDGASFYFIQSSAYRMPAADVLLDLRRPECAHRVRDVLAAGVRCALWPHMLDRTGLTRHDKSHAGCDCNETGWRIAPADLDWTRNLPAWQAAAVLTTSVLRVAAGEEPVLGVLGPYTEGHRGMCRDVTYGGGMLRLKLGVLVLRTPASPHVGWFCERGGERGPEVGTVGQRLADAAALRERFVLDNGDHLLVPLPGGRVARVEAEVSGG